MRCCVRRTKCGVHRTLTLADEKIMKPMPKESEWKYDENGRVSNRALAEMIVSSLYYAKPPVVTDKNYDRAVDIAEEEINVVDIMGKEHLKEKQNNKGSQQSGAGYPPQGVGSPDP